ncbi:hypothetical protein [Methylorubrum zatmanii]|uniref:Uncharacterized protein n=1 Tax=Methylorubrum zatmanii TaxID=29429 RepID=A0ABW1WRG9_9HYPH
MADLFASGRIVDAILVLVLIETLALLGWRARFGGAGTAALLCTLASGAALMLSLRAALTGADWSVVALWLTVSLVAHLGDLVLRFRRSGAASRGAVTGRSGTTGDRPRSVRVVQ